MTQHSSIFVELTASRSKRSRDRRSSRSCDVGTQGNHSGIGCENGDCHRHEPAIPESRTESGETKIRCVLPPKFGNIVPT